MKTKYERLTDYITEMENLFDKNTDIFSSHVESILLQSMGDLLAAFEHGVPAEEYFQTYLETEKE